MRKITKNFLLTTALISILGIVIFGLCGCSEKQIFENFNNKEFITNTYEIDEYFNHIAISTDTTDILFEKSEDGKCKVVCYEEKTMTHSVSVDSDTLFIDFDESKKLSGFIKPLVEKAKITVYLPDDTYSLFIKGSTGNIKIPESMHFTSSNITISTGNINFSATSNSVVIVASTGDVELNNTASDQIKVDVSTGNITLKDLLSSSIVLSTSTGSIKVSDVIVDGDISTDVTTGDVHFTNINCNNLLSTGTSGHVELNNVIAKEKLNVTRTTGDVNLKSADAEEVFIKTSTGNVKGSFLTNKIFIVRTSTGDIDVPGSISGGKCEITTTTGDIKISFD